MAKIETWKFASKKGQTAGLEPVLINPPPKTLNEASSSLPQGVYTTFRTYAGTKVLPLQDHIHRLEESSQLVGKPVYIDSEIFVRILSQALSVYYSNLHYKEDENSPENESKNSRIRITLDLENEPGRIYISIEPLKVPTPLDYQGGVRVVIIHGQRSNPKAKQTDFIITGETIRQELPERINEALLVGEEGRILEGLSSNFFAIKNGSLWTAETGILPGITRSLALQAANLEGLPVHLEGLPVSAIGSIDGAFITSSSRSILPVRMINYILVGNGHPDELTRRLMRKFSQEIQSRLIQLPVIRFP